MDINTKIIEISSVDSTNTYMSKLLKGGVLADETIVWAHSQTKGRGQKGNSWFSKDNKNITCSIVIYPKFLAIEKQFYISILTSLSIIDFLKKKNTDFSIKWPNDIYYKDSKIAGILVENSISGSSLTNSIIGVGININQENFPPEIPNPISLTSITGVKYDLKEQLNRLSYYFHVNYEILKSGQLQQLKIRYMENLYLFNKTNKFKDSKGEFLGKIIDILETGEIVIEDESCNKRFYMFKEVEFVLGLN